MLRTQLVMESQAVPPEKKDKSITSITKQSTERKLYLQNLNASPA